MSVPRGGKDKIGYTEEDGAEFTSKADYTMSWSSFEYAADVWVNVTLKTGQAITSADQVTIRPTDLGLKKRLVNSSTVAVKVPYSKDGYRFSVEFDPQQVTAYNDLSGGSGTLTTEEAGNRAIHTEPQNSMLVFANPKPTAKQAAELIPSKKSGLHLPAQGRSGEQPQQHQPGDRLLRARHLLHGFGLPRRSARQRQVGLPGAGRVREGRLPVPPRHPEAYKVTGLGVLSGEQYVYEADTTNGYQHNVNENCHVTCVKMLQFESSNTGQTLAAAGRHRQRAAVPLLRHLRPRRCRAPRSVSRTSG